MRSGPGPPPTIGGDCWFVNAAFQGATFPTKEAVREVVGCMVDLTPATVHQLMKENIRVCIQIQGERGKLENAQYVLKPEEVKHSRPSVVVWTAKNVERQRGSPGHSSDHEEQTLTKTNAE